jgi:GcrA cell cycle regulator
MSWTDERVALLKKMWCEGKTAAEIAKELGDVTRNAVIGKAHRLRLSNRVSPIQQNNKKPAPKAAEEKPAARRSAPVPAREIEVLGVSMAELKDRMCRWPIGDPREDNFHFCGLESVTGLPYCPEHSRIAYQAATRSRILQPEDFERTPAHHDDDHHEDVKEAVA